MIIILISVDSYQLPIPIYIYLTFWNWISERYFSRKQFTIS